MREKIIAGNWKMNKTEEEALSLAAEIVGMTGTEVRSSHTIILAPPFPFIGPVSRLVASDSRIKVAAQNCSDQESGAYTGEVSAKMVKSAGGEYVIIGHSERRNYFKENSEQLKNKVTRALEAGCKVIFCIGESLAERNSNDHFKIVKSQLEQVIFILRSEQLKDIVIAYEPVWAIGTGITASPAQAQEMHAYIRSLFTGKYGTAAGSVSILYGGSCNEKNASELFALPDVDGGLIGGASLKSRSFIDIVKSMT